MTMKLSTAWCPSILESNGVSISMGPLDAFLKFFVFVKVMVHEDGMRMHEGA